MTAMTPYSRPNTLAKLDGRTREARLLRQTRAELSEHVGGNPSATQRALIERACQLTLRVAAMDRRFLETGTHTEHDTAHYLAWSNSLARVLRDLGARAAPMNPPPTLADHLAKRRAEAAAA